MKPARIFASFEGGGPARDAGLVAGANLRRLWRLGDANAAKSASTWVRHELRLRQRLCAVHGHNHALAWSSRLPIADLKSFWGALGCACWAV